MRQYQQRYDPTAFFLTAWLPPPHEVREIGNPADFMRRPQTDTNVALEAMLNSADRALREQDFLRANVLLDSVIRVMDNGGVFLDPLGSSYLKIVQISTALGYEIQSVDLQGETDTALATTTHGYTLTELQLELRRDSWVLLSN
jgi:hypothetical protein